MEQIQNQQPKWKKIWHNEKYEAEYWTGKIRNAATGFILNPRKKKSGYYYVKLTCAKHTTREYLHHRVVAQAHKKGYSPNKVANHKDKDKSNCAGWNVEWLTHRQNIAHRDNKNDYKNY